MEGPGIQPTPRTIRLVSIAAGILVSVPSCGDSRPQTGPGVVYVGQESHPTREVSEPIVRYRLGEPEGPGMIFQGDIMSLAPAPPDGILVFTAYSSDGPVQLFRRGRLDREFGRQGSGPGEYRFPSGILVEPATGRVWLGDGLRMVSFLPDGSPGPTLNASHAGSSVWDRLFLRDGSLLLVAPGGPAEHLGFLLHRYDFTTRNWSSHLRVARDAADFPYGQPRAWQRKAALAPDGKVLLVSHDYEILVLEPRRDFEVERTIIRRPPGWPDDPALDHAQGRLEHPLYPGFGLADAWSDPEGRLWVLTVQPKADWQDDLREDPHGDVHGGFIRAGPDHGMDSLVEVLDPESWELPGSFRFSGSLRSIVGPGLVARYAGDLPFPRIEVLQVPFQEE